jgi:hypothetical protein
MSHTKRKLLVIAISMASVTAYAAGQTAVPVSPNSSLAASTSTQIAENVLQLPNATNGFTFSGVTAAGSFYTDYLFTIGNAADVQTAALTMSNASGVANFTQRIYSYDGSFYDKASGSNSAATLLLGQTTSIPAYGVTFSNVALSRIAAGTYVLELRGSTVGNYAGTISVTPVPEPEMLIMMALGLGLICADRRKHISAK